MYSCGAFSTLLSESLESHDRVVQECTDAFEPGSWAVLSAEGQMLLRTLLNSVHAPQARLLTLLQHC